MSVVANASEPRLRMSRREAQQQLSHQIKIGRAIKGQRIRDRWELDHARAEKQEWVRRATETLEAVFANLDAAGKFNEWTAPILPEYAELEMFIELFGEEMRQRLSTMQEACDMLNHATEPGPIASGPGETILPAAAASPPTTDTGNGLLLCAGGEASAADSIEAIERFVSQLELNSTRFDPAADSAPILEYLESSQTVLAIFVEPNTASMFDLGCCMGRLGQDRVCVMVPAGKAPPLPVGVNRLSIDNGDAWQLGLARALRAGGIEVDLNKLL